jgi:hypothetical protein
LALINTSGLKIAGTTSLKNRTQTLQKTMAKGFAKINIISLKYSSFCHLRSQGSKVDLFSCFDCLSVKGSLTVFAMLFRKKFSMHRLEPNKKISSETASEGTYIERKYFCLSQ